MKNSIATNVVSVKDTFETVAPTMNTSDQKLENFLEDKRVLTREEVADIVCSFFTKEELENMEILNYSGNFVSLRQQILDHFKNKFPYKNLKQTKETAECTVKGFKEGLKKLKKEDLNQLGHLFVPLLSGILFESEKGFFASLPNQLQERKKEMTRRYNRYTRFK